jgi:hypothetical protein
MDFNQFTLDGGVSNPNCTATTGRSKRRTDNSNIDAAYERRRQARVAKKERVTGRHGRVERNYDNNDNDKPHSIARKQFKRTRKFHKRK